MSTQLTFPNPFPVSANLCSFQKGSGVTVADAKSCPTEVMLPGDAANKLQELYPALDDQTIWTTHAAIVSDCDEFVYGPTDVTLRQLVANLKSLCVVDDSCLVSIIENILGNPILNYRARYLEARRLSELIAAENQKLTDAYYAAQRSSAARSLRSGSTLTKDQKCAIVNSVKDAIKSIKTTSDNAESRQIRCCLAACLDSLCKGGASDIPIPPPELLDVPCPCPPISCEVLSNACVVIKVLAPATEGGASDVDVTCDSLAACACPDAGTRDVLAGIDYPTNCLLPTGAEYDPRAGAFPSRERAVVLTFRAGRNCVTGDGVVEEDGFPSTEIVP